MKFFFYSVCICLIFFLGTDGRFSDVSYAESDIEVMGTGSSGYQDDEPVTQEMIDAEEELLEKKIREINETPVEKFGSLVHKNQKRANVAYQLKLLRESPEMYFKNKKNQ